jgi:Cholesterol uptake porter CUP1 of Mce4, putative/Permease MlaE
VLDGLGRQLSFHARTYRWTPRAVRRYWREVCRLLAEVSLGSGGLAVIGGTVAVVAFMTATVGAGFTAQLGAMRVGDEIDALEVMAIPPIPYWFGSVITDLDAYLGGLNPSLPALHQDLDKTPDVLRTYTDITPDLLRIGANASFTSDTLVGKRVQLAAFPVSLTEFGDHTAGFLTDTERPFVSALDVLRPTTRLLADYSEMFPCLFEGLDLNRMLLDKVVDGGAVNAVLAPGLGAQPYRYPDSLPVIGKGTGPDCHGLPGHPTTRVPRPQPQSALPPLSEILFGKVAPR